MSMSVVINNPSAIAPPMTSPIAADGSVTSLAGRLVQAMWYQIDGADAVNIDTFNADGSTWNFSADVPTTGSPDHTLAVYAMSDEPDIQVSYPDRIFTVS